MFLSYLNLCEKVIKMIILFLKSLVFTLIVPGTVAVILPTLITENNQLGSEWFNLSGLLLMAVAFVIYLWCVWDFVKWGKGTPAPIDAPKVLVIRGLYQYTRNPMYVAVLLFLIGWNLLYMLPDLLLYTGVVGLIFQLLVVFYEEPILMRVFATEYQDYKATVNRWLPASYSKLLLNKNG